MYKTILLDIDNTLLDYPKAEKYAIKATFEDFDFFSNGSESEFEEIKKEYKVINDLLWEKLEKGEITSTELKVERFRMEHFFLMKLKRCVNTCMENTSSE